MSSLARAEGYDTPAHQRKDSTTFIASESGIDLQLDFEAQKKKKNGSGDGPLRKSISQVESFREPFCSSKIAQGMKENDCSNDSVGQNASPTAYCSNPSLETESVQRYRILTNGFIKTKLSRADLASARKIQGADIQQCEPAVWNQPVTCYTSWDELYAALSK